MEIYIVNVPYAGYSRGNAVYKVVANSLEEALENVDRGEFDYLDPIRDDTEKEFDNAEEYLNETT